MELYLLRHGHSEANGRGLVTGTKEDALTEKGRSQAEEAARMLDFFGIGRNSSVRRYASDWRRARESAALAAPGESFAVDARLGETDAGTAAAMPRAEFSRLHPEFRDDFQPERRYPGGESHRDLFDRVLAWLADLEKALAEEEPETGKALAVTHAGPVCCLLHAVCGTPLTRFPAYLAMNASLTLLRRARGGPWRLAFFSLPCQLGRQGMEIE